MAEEEYDKAGKSEAPKGKKKKWSYSSCKAWSQKNRAVYSLSSALGLPRETRDLLFWTLTLLGWFSVCLPRWGEAVSINLTLLTECSVSQTSLPKPWLLSWRCLPWCSRVWGASVGIACMETRNLAGAQSLSAKFSWYIITHKGTSLPLLEQCSISFYSVLVFPLSSLSLLSFSYAVVYQLSWEDCCFRRLRWI